MKNIKSKKSVIKLTGIIITSFVVGILILHLFPKNAANKRDINIILIVVDALRVDHLSCYGYKRETSPHIDRLAAEGTMFTQAISAGSWTGESVLSILTGTYSYIHQAIYWNEPRNPSIKLLPQHLKKKGFKSILLSNHDAMSMVDIMDGFDLIYIKNPDEINAHQLTLKAIEWIKQNKDRPFFVYLHYLGPHAPYKLPKPYKSKYVNDRFRVKKEIPIDWNNARIAEKGKIPNIVVENNIQDIDYYIAQYDGAISYTDAQIGCLLDNLRQRELLKNTIVIITADHGEEFGEHEIYFNHLNCYEGNIRVPLIIKFPEFFPERKIISQQVSLTDITPTILATLKLDIPDFVQGKSLMPLLRKDTLKFHPYVYTSQYPQRSIRSENWKLILNDTSCELYNLIEDPQEKYNLANVRIDKLMEMNAVLVTYEGESVVPGWKRTESLTEKQKERLRSLGYIR
ncbi:MAG: sulfatase [Deltaproteobacteria bacterium]|nr:sulfatase [Deltaproteobacteria bacterium]